MAYPSTWKEDRKLGRRGGFQGRRRLPRARLPGATSTGSRINPLKDFQTAKRFAAVGARVGVRFIPWVGIGILAVEVGWYVYHRQGVAGRLQPFAPPTGWTVGNASCDSDDGFNKQYHEGNPFCIGPFAFVTDIHPWGTQIPPGKDILHRLKRDGASQTKGQTVAWWNRSGATDNTPRGGYVTSPVIPTSPIDPWERVDPINHPLHPVPQVVPDPHPASPYPRQVIRDWRSPTESTQLGPIPKPPVVIIVFNPNDLPFRRPKPEPQRSKKGRPPPWWPFVNLIDIEPEDLEEEPHPEKQPRESEDPDPRVDPNPLFFPRGFREGFPPWWKQPIPVTPRILDPEPVVTDRQRRDPDRARTRRTDPEVDPLPRTFRPPAFSPGVLAKAPPGPGVKERKARTKSPVAFVLVRALFEQVFETFDYVEAIYNSLPQNVRKWYERELDFGHRDPIQQMQVIHRHYDLIDIPEMINNLILNEFEDFIFGLLGRISAISAQRMGLSVGPQFGQGSLRSHSQRVAHELELQRLKQNLIQFVEDEVETFK